MSEENNSTIDNKKINEIKQGVEELTKDTITISKQLFQQLQQSNLFIIANALNAIDKYDAIVQSINFVNKHIIDISRELNELSILIGKEKDIQKALYRNTTNAITGNVPPNQQQQNQNHNPSTPSPRPPPPPTQP